MEKYLCDKLPDDFKFWNNLPTLINERFTYWDIQDEIAAEHAAGAILIKRSDGTTVAKVPTYLLQPQGWDGLGTIYVHPSAWSMFWHYIEEGMFLGKGKVPLDRDTITPYLKYYFDGFQKGYYSFDEKIKTSTTSLFGLTEKEIVKKIYEYSKPDFLSPIGIFPFTLGLEGGSNISEESWIEAGEEIGMLYRCWYIILTNPDKFIEHFAEDAQQSTPPPIADVAEVADKEVMKERSGVEIIPEVRERFNEVIKRKFSEHDRPLLLSLLQGFKINKKILFNGRASQIANALGQMWKSGYINAPDMRAVDTWLSDYVQYNNATGPTDIRPDSQYDHIRLAKRCKNAIIEIDSKTKQIITTNQ